MITASSPHDFYVQLSTDSNDMRLADISAKIKEIISLPRGSSNFQIGSLVIAPYEDEYFRAKILSRVKGGFRVLFLDYGNVCVVPKKSLYPLDDVALLNEPPAALHCRLVDVIWTNGYLSWPEEVSEFFHKMTTDIGKDLLMTIVPVSTPNEDSSIISVALRDNSMSLIGPIFH
ncbi:PREDICTED: uncharacterized protein LOC109587872 [Amphimedon queenslandica]|uniref:Tudor domain-containing protein n=1 Tax=Amphimedon queenslandica TaxID=400682 RepID=A0AAN0JS09_AMPQE|nr:PREDICTED: uncharacterized protein LOC109587872 [Amphimedon queenslandica]|eukprot:XP_019859650.1 PREDICTED: uncharacterized protein LOC109587872 [Amphimedon queenslandica]